MRTPQIQTNLFLTMLALPLGVIGCAGQSPRTAAKLDQRAIDRAPPAPLLTEVELLLDQAGRPVPCDAEDPFGPECPRAIPRGYSTTYRPGELLIFNGPIAPGTYTIKVNLYGDRWRGNQRVVQEQATRRGVVFELEKDQALTFPLRAVVTGKETRTFRIRVLAGGHFRDEDVCDLPTGWGDLCSRRRSTHHTCKVSLPGPPRRSFRAQGCELRALFISLGNQICQATARGHRQSAVSGIKQSELRRLIRCTPGPSRSAAKSETVHPAPD